MALFALLVLLCTELAASTRLVQTEDIDSPDEEVILLQAGTLRPATADEQTAFLDAHNEVRCMHGSPAVTWSDAMAASAAEYVGPLKTLAHSDCYHIAPPAGPAGENLYWSSRPSTPHKVVNSWYDEVDDCKGGPTSFKDGCRKGVRGAATGHFTALIWKGAKEIGCAWSEDKKIALCRYKGDDVLNKNTPNMLPQSNYEQQVPHKIKDRAACGSGRPQPGPSPAPPRPVPSPSPSDCVDSSTYRDAGYGWPCSKWASWRCSGYSFSPDLMRHCPAACRQCTPGSPSPAPAKPNGDQCVTGSGAGHCTLKSAGCAGQISVSVKCKGKSGRHTTVRLSMPDDYTWDISDTCSVCHTIEVVS